MVQIALMPQIQGDKLKTAIPAEGGDLVTQITANGEIIGATFDQALQEMLMAQGEQDVLFLSLATSTADPLQPQTITPRDGRVLPLQLQLDGKPLPLLISQQQAAFAEPALDGAGQLKPLQSQPQLMQPEFLIQRLIENGQSQPLKLQLREIGAQLLDSGRSVESTGQLSAFSLQLPVSSSTGMRPSIVMPLDIPVGQAGWDRAVGERIQWMVGQNIQQAEIKLNPPHLGPLEIKISLQNDQTSVTFVASQAPTREALEASIPRLRELFGEINLNLANVDVGQQQAGESAHDRRAGPDSNGTIGSDSLSPDQTREQGQTWIMGGDGLLDTYA
ncbi:MAG: flagellar hook-length control protein FliK [Candidatus Thiodiazotropha endolucinida]